MSRETAMDLLRSCFSESVKVGFDAVAEIITSPLIGKGARRVSLRLAMDCAANRLRDLYYLNNNNLKLANDLKDKEEMKEASATLLVVLEPSIA